MVTILVGLFFIERPNLNASRCRQERNQKWLFVCSRKIKISCWAFLDGHPGKILKLSNQDMNQKCKTDQTNQIHFPQDLTKNMHQEIQPEMQPLNFPVHTKNYVWSGWLLDTYRLGFKRIFLLLHIPFLDEKNLNVHWMFFTAPSSLKRPWLRLLPLADHPLASRPFPPPKRILPSTKIHSVTTITTTRRQVWPLMQCPLLFLGQKTRLVCFEGKLNNSLTTWLHSIFRGLAPSGASGHTTPSGRQKNNMR